MTATDKVRFYNRLRTLREDRGVSRKALAEAVEVHPQTIGYIERRQYNLSLALAFRLAGYFDMTLDQVFSTAPFDD